MNAKICVHNQEGDHELPCEVIGESKTGYKCRMLDKGWLPRRNVIAGQIVHVPKYAVFIDRNDGIQR
jgi:hypothetical protein